MKGVAPGKVRHIFQVDARGVAVVLEFTPEWATRVRTLEDLRDRLRGGRA